MKKMFFVVTFVTLIVGTQTLSVAQEKKTCPGCNAYGNEIQNLEELVAVYENGSNPDNLLRPRTGTLSGVETNEVGLHISDLANVYNSYYRNHFNDKPARITSKAQLIEILKTQVVIVPLTWEVDAEVYSTGWIPGQEKGIPFKRTAYSGEKFAAIKLPNGKYWIWFSTRCLNPFHDKRVYSLEEVGLDLDTKRLDVPAGTSIHLSFNISPTATATSGDAVVKESGNSTTRDLGNNDDSDVYDDEPFVVRRKKVVYEQEDQQQQTECFGCEEEMAYRQAMLRNTRAQTGLQAGILGLNAVQTGFNIFSIFRGGSKKAKPQGAFVPNPSGPVNTSGGGAFIHNGSW